jgi:hypothetical protein
MLKHFMLASTFLLTLGIWHDSRRVKDYYILVDDAGGTVIYSENRSSWLPAGTSTPSIYDGDCLQRSAKPI